MATRQDLKNLQERRESLNKEIEEVKGEIHALEMPQALENPDFSKLIEVCVSQTEHVAAHGWETKDAEYQVYETAVKAIFGSDYFDWFNVRLR